MALQEGLRQVEWQNWLVLAVRVASRIQTDPTAAAFAVLGHLRHSDSRLDWVLPEVAVADFARSAPKAAVVEA